MEDSDFDVIDAVTSSEEEEEWVGSCDEAFEDVDFSALENRHKPHPPWQGHGDKLVGIVDMGRQGHMSTQSQDVADNDPTVMAFAFLSQIYRLLWPEFSQLSWCTDPQSLSTTLSLIRSLGSKSRYLIMLLIRSALCSAAFL